MPSSRRRRSYDLETISAISDPSMHDPTTLLVSEELVLKIVEKCWPYRTSDSFVKLLQKVGCCDELTFAKKVAGLSPSLQGVLVGRALGTLHKSIAGALQITESCCRKRFERAKLAMLQTNA